MHQVKLDFEIVPKLIKTDKLKFLMPPKTIHKYFLLKYGLEFNKSLNH